MKDTLLKKILFCKKKINYIEMIRAYYTNTFLRQTRHCRLKLFETPLDNKGKLAFLAPQASLFLPYLFATFGLGHFATCHGIFKAVRPFGHQLSVLFDKYKYPCLI